MWGVKGKRSLLAGEMDIAFGFTVLAHRLEVFGIAQTTRRRGTRCEHKGREGVTKKAVAWRQDGGMRRTGG